MPARREIFLGALIAVGAACGDNRPPLDAPPLDAAARCSPFDAACGTGLKCTVTDPAPDGTTVTACLPAGTLGDGMTCATSAMLGHDECAAGLLCSALGLLDLTAPQSKCRRYCSATRACAAGDGCFPVSDDYTIGVCVPRCTPFGTDCPTDFDCSNALPDIDRSDLRLVCRHTGTTAVGGSCGHDLDCVAGSICDPIRMPRTCLALCDGQHPCAAGSCFPIPGTNAGACVQ